MRLINQSGRALWREECAAVERAAAELSAGFGRRMFSATVTRTREGDGLRGVMFQFDIYEARDE